MVFFLPGFAVPVVLDFARRYFFGRAVRSAAVALLPAVVAVVAVLALLAIPVVLFAGYATPPLKKKAKRSAAGRKPSSA